MTNFQIAQLSLQAVSVLGVLATFVFALRTLRLNVAAYRDLHDWNRRKAAHDAVGKYRDFADDGRKIGETFSSAGGFDPLPLEAVKDKIHADPTLRISIHKLFNFYEELASGVRYAVFDEGIVRDSLQTAMMQSFVRFTPYIEHLRHNGRPRAYREYELLVKRWQDEANVSPERRPTGANA
jgi:hypothetical protein